jgi:hypothetical protein
VDRGLLLYRIPPPYSSTFLLFAGFQLDAVSKPKLFSKSLDKTNPLDYHLGMITVVELPEFTRRSKRLLTEGEVRSLITHLAAYPASGVIMRGTGGIRKIRWKREGTGKSAGVRVIYYFHNENYPLFLLTVFGKSAKANLSQAERNELAKLTRILIESYGDKR